MQNKNTFAVRFYCRDSKVAKKTGLAPIELSIIVNGERVFVTLPRKMSPKDFEKDMAKRSGNETKTFVSVYESKVNNAVTEILQRNESLTAMRIKDYVTGSVVHTHTLKSLISEHLSLLRERTRAEITLARYRRYESTYDDFLKFMGDMEIDKVTTADMMRYKTDVLSKRQASTAYGFLSRCKTLFRFGIQKGWLRTNPMSDIKLSKGIRKKQIPTMEEYFKIVSSRFEIDRLEKVREVFVLAASTGLSYSDIMSLTPQDIKKDKEGSIYIEKVRNKTNVTYTSVVLKEGVDILEKYNYDISPLKKSDQKMNGYLLEIQNICGIKCRITMHVGRHLYCSRLIQSGVNMSIVQRALGHSKITTTQSYYTHLTTESVIKNIKKAVN